jgi:Carboxypeptidase regulatory-like domain
MKMIPVTLLVLCGASAIAFADATLSGRVLDLNDQPVGGATVTIKSADGTETRAVTDPTGRYAVQVATTGAHWATFTLGKVVIGGQVDVPADGKVTLDSRLPVGGEIIEVQGNQPARHAKPKTDPLTIPPYSDKAILGDYWSKAWLLLDVNERGVVERVKFLQRPGHDLDDIAVKYAFGMTFDPARDKHGVPIGTYIVWPLEWPSVEWLQLRQQPRTRLPTLPEVIQTDHGPVFDSYPPCAEAVGGTSLSMYHPIQRSCAVPDLSRMDASEPWIARDASVPPPVVAPAPIIDLRQERADRIANARQNRTYAIIATAATVATVAGLVVSYQQFKKYSDRYEEDQMNTVAFPSHLDSDRNRRNSWELGMIGFAAGTMVGGIATGYFWSHASHLSLQPRGDGGAISYAGSF